MSAPQPSGKGKGKGKELQVLGGFAVDADTAFVLAVQPDERGSANQRSFIFRVRADAAAWVQTLAVPLQRCWLSRAMVAYCTSATGAVMVFDRGHSSSERVCPRAEELDAIFGFSGEGGGSDTLFVCGSASLFERRAGAWLEHTFADDVTEVYRLHGLAPNKLYVCTDIGIYGWNGTELAERAGPDDEVGDLFARSPDELVAVGDAVHLWTQAQGWRRLKSPFKQHSVGLCSTGDALYIPSRYGVLRLTGTELAKVSGVPSGQLVAVGSNVLAAGRDGGLSWYDGSRWTSLPLPRLARGEPL